MATEMGSNESVGGEAPAYLEELRLKGFKSFTDARLPLGDLTLLIGRNGSGKSNALEALETLALLATGDDIRDAIDGSRVSGSPIRGGVTGCAPYGQKQFAIGCTVRLGGRRFHYDVEIATDPDVQVVAERLWKREGQGGERDLLVTDPAEADSADIRARYDSGRRGTNPAASFRASRLLLTQVATRVPTSTKAMRAVHEAAEAVVAALRAIFVLDPVPQEMREYVPERDAQLRRQADNLSAVVARLRGDDAVWDRMRTLVESLPEQQVGEITVERSPLGDVILALHERYAGRDHPVSARMMSDGMLRYMAFAAALLEAPLTDAGPSDAQTMLVIEEVENGLHPSQAARVVTLIKEESARRRVRTLATTHSPAMLSALAGQDHPFVVLCDRDAESGGSRLRRLTDLPNYERAMAQGPLGDGVTRGRLQAPAEDFESNALDRLIAAL